MENQQNWKQKRKKGIGGSEIAAIIGANQYKTAYDVYMDKINSDDQDDSNANTIAGNILEDSVARFAEEYYNVSIFNDSGDNILYEHPHKPIVRGTPDRFYKDLNKEGVGIMEIKTTQASIDKDDLPDQWVVQLCWYMGIINALNKHNEKNTPVYGSIAYIHSGRFLNFDKVDFDFDEKMQDLFASLVEEAEKFWNNSILKQTPPEPQSPEDVIKLTNKDNIKEYQEAGEEILSIHGQLKDKKQELKAMEEEVKNLERTIKMTIGAEYKGLQYEGEKIVDWTPMDGKISIDKTKLKNDFPEVYEQVKKQGKPFRMLKIK